MSRLERWSRKKRGLESDDVMAPEPAQASEEAPVLADAHVHQEAPADPAEPPAPAPGSLDDTLPDPDTLPAGSDFSAFMAAGVSSALRRRALRRLWATGNYNVRDGLDDYDADYTQQLKPMASELAGKLRRWTHQAEEASEVPQEESTPAAESRTEPRTEPQDTPSADHTEEMAACNGDGSFVQRTDLDDQSDLSCHARRERSER